MAHAKLGGELGLPSVSTQNQGDPFLQLSLSSEIPPILSSGFFSLGPLVTKTGFSKVLAFYSSTTEASFGS